MRAFLAACAAAIILAIGGVFLLGALQKPSGAAFATEGVRIDPSWSWRQMFRRPADNQPAPRAHPAAAESGAAAHLAPESCEQTNAYRWLSVDFGETKDNDACAVSQ